MRLLRLRLGAATNSSSTHSIVYGPNLVGDMMSNYEFGWEHFVAKTTKSKLMYFSAALWHSMTKKSDYNKNGIPIGKAQDYVAECYPELDDLDPGWRKSFADGWSVYVDHQSCPYCPLYLNDRPNIEFYRCVTEPFIFHEDIAIEGGNDNSGYYDSLLGRPVDTGVLDMLIDARWRIRDEDFGWVMINERSGNKVTLGREECTDLSWLT